MPCDFTSFYNISVISERWEGDNKKLRAIESTYGWKVFCPMQVLNSGLLDQLSRLQSNLQLALALSLYVLFAILRRKDKALCLNI